MSTHRWWWDEQGPAGGTGQVKWELGGDGRVRLPLTRLRPERNRKQMQSSNPASMEVTSGDETRGAGLPWWSRG